MNQPRYLIIAGSTKCGTTSLFNYLEFHPEICPCIMKESRYFWDGDYQPGVARNKALVSGSFESLFRECSDNKIRLEATPDYLYSSSTAHRIHKDLKNARIVFLLRDPIDRLHSWYRFSLQNGFIASTVDFDSYVRLQLETNDSRKPNPQHLRSLEQGKYASYLKHYYSLFGAENIHVNFYENLVATPANVCRELAILTGIDPDYFDTVAFKIYNPSAQSKSVQAHRLFRKLKRAVRPVTRKLPTGVRKSFKLAGYHAENLFRKANKRSDIPGVGIVENDTALFLKSYYHDDIKQLISLTGKTPPWKTYIDR